jgi:5,10-methylenetetrahydromethanopterin reductase
MRFSYQLLPEHPLADLLGTLELLDQLGFWACYSADETYHEDMWSLFAAGAARTSRLRLGAEVAGVILKDPTLVAVRTVALSLSSAPGISRCSSNTTSRPSSR